MNQSIIPALLGTQINRLDQLPGIVGWWSARTIANLYQDAAATTPVTVDGNPVGKILDLSSNANHAFRGNSLSLFWDTHGGSGAQLSSDTQRPIYKSDSFGPRFLYNDVAHALGLFDSASSRAVNRTIYLLGAFQANGYVAIYNQDQPSGSTVVSSNIDGDFYDGADHQVPGYPIAQSKSEDIRVFTTDASRGTIYLNGVFAGSVGISPGAANTNNVSLFSTGNTTGAFAHSFVDIAVFNQVHTPAQMKAGYNYLAKVRASRGSA